MRDATGVWRDLAEYARWAPSPHNTQPTRLRIIDEHRAEVHFLRERGLPVGDPQGRFTQLTFGVMIEILAIAASAKGYELEASYVGRPLYERDEPLQKIADLTLKPAAGQRDDLEPALILQRRTNRHPYDRRPVPGHAIAELQQEAQRYGHTLTVSTDPAAIQWLKELNRDALWNDLEHEPYRNELASWLRYSADEARARRDGLSPQTLVLPGWLLQAFMRRHRLATAPVVRQLVRRIYMRTMTGISTVGWIQGDYVTIEDWIRAGRLMLRLWLILTRHGLYWQPYGSIITNDALRQAMVAKFGMREGAHGADMVWLLVRLGHSRHAPAASERLPLEEILV